MRRTRSASIEVDVVPDEHYVPQTRHRVGGEAGLPESDCHGHAPASMLWEHGAAYDLNHLIGRSSLHLAQAFYLNNRGEIATQATLPNGDMHVALLVPASLAASEGLSSTPDTHLATADQRAVPRSIPDPRDLFTSIRERLAAASRPGLPY